MQFFNASSLLILSLTGAVMFGLNSIGVEYSSPLAIGSAGLFLTVVAFAFEINLIHPRLVYMPLWFAGLFPTGYGLYSIGVGYIAIEVVLCILMIHWLNNRTLKSHRTAAHITHNYMESTDGDTLRDEIRTNLDHRDEAIRRARDGE